MFPYCKVWCSVSDNDNIGVEIKGCWLSRLLSLRHDTNPLTEQQKTELIKNIPEG